MEYTQETQAWQDHRNGLAWQRAMGFDEKFPQYVRFKEGDQWPPATRRTRNLPRPVFNMVEMFIRTKRAAVLDSPLSMSCRPAAGSGPEAQLALQGARDFTDYARQLWKRLHQDDLNAQMVDDAATEGTGVLHYYWDTTVRGTGSTPFVGEVRGESIDPLAIVFSDPQCRDIQKQRWILLRQRMPLQEAQAMARAAGVPEEKVKLLRADHEGEPYPMVRESDRERRVTVLTRYFRRDGEVWFEKCTRLQHIVPPRPLTPEGSAARMERYPVALLAWKLRKSCVFGIGEAECLLPSQKALNYNMAMMLLSVQQTGWPKLLTRPGALQQPVTNEPGELLVDHWSGGGDGIKYLQAPTFSSLAVGLSEKVLALSRDINGVGQVTTGDTDRLDLAASAIIALQNQAKTPIREIQRRFLRVVEDVGGIWLDFFRCYCTTPRPVAAEGESLPLPRSFVGADYAGIEYEMLVDVGAASEYSEALSQATLEKLLDKNYITVEQYVELSGPNVVPFRERFLQMRREAAQKSAQLPVSGLPLTERRQPLGGGALATAGSPLTEGAGGTLPAGMPVAAAPLAGLR